MSRKSKLILATALFGAALFGASCGGGDSGGTTAGTGTGGGGGGGTPSPTEEGKVLALLDVGGASAGPLKPVAICRLMSNEKAECGTDLNPTANVDLRYAHEFPNGNVVLVDTDGIIYFFNGSQVVRPDKYRRVGGISDISAPGGIGILSGSGVKYYATPNFLIAHDSSNGKLVVVTREGKVIKEDSGVTDVNTSCETVTKGTTTYKLNTDGTSFSTTIPTSIPTTTSVSGKYLVRDGDKVYLSDSRCSATGVLVDTISTTINEAQMVKVIDSNNNPHFFIAMRTAGTSVRYYRVSGNTATGLATITLNTAGKYYYALDGRGVLYANVTNANTVAAYKPTDGSSIGTATVTGVSALLPFANRVLAKGSAGVSDVYASDTAVTVTSKGDTSSALYTALDRCTDASDTRAINGVHTNFIRCVYESGTTRVLYSLTTDDSGTYGSTSYTLPDAFDNVRWAPNKALVSVGSGPTILLCNTTTTPTISCSPTDLPAIDPTNINSYLKSNGNNVFYVRSGGVLKVGNIFDPPSALPIIVSDASGGNASFNLNKFAFSFRPAGAACNTQIAYLSSPTASPKYYTIAQPSNACVTRILKTFP